MEISAPKPTREQKVILKRMAATLEAMPVKDLVYEISLCKVAEGEHPLYAKALGAEVERRLKKSKANGKKEG